MKSFSTQQLSVFINQFGQDITLADGSIVKGILEQEEIVFEDVITSQKYFTALKGSIKLNQKFKINSEEFIVENIRDDLSGLIDVYYRMLK